ncbi:hypothetical protein BACT_1000 [Bifidobacterium actinocoloniiforme DSM 22766]|uniref:YwiC-like protein n=1 Tax=Bifidobacterium actinocoloniiforme DSM 22766 TaxID=1437605 RepID=A0A086Z198_9BIFI|nr:YwiC-like family protein [Bifidobacterium actinocoloniiforme]AKV55460.1 hypothetical protein AB656_03610 [Bifidobacterium actinocoloniiforme DSM 22766]KFI40298.1 hypothetical protein BACT_1000 [Bifidobacterium actinocoloniiforme DSM 22766]
MVTSSHQSTSGQARARRSRLWLPAQPGAWVMALLPTLGGCLIARLSWHSLLLLLAWTLAYCTQFTVARWIASRLARRYQAPALTYAGATALLGICLLVAAPGLSRWIPVYLLLAVVSFLAAYLRRERSLWNDADAVIAASLTCLMASSLTDAPAATLQASGSAGRTYWACQGNPAVYCFADGPLTRQALPAAGLVAAIVFALGEFGSVLFVKTMIRERGKRTYYLASVGWNILLVAASLPLTRILGPWPPLVALLLLARAAAIPPLAPQGWKPARVGAVEAVASLVVFALALALASALA